MIVANHTSMTDIMLMLATVKTLLFSLKSRIKQDTLFGFFYKRTCILVDRGCSKSRLKVFNEAQRLDRGLSVCIFPEGGVPDDESLLWIRLRMVHSDLLLNIKFNSSY
jgi:1-acyl-sn-glycerol-3-phosphate acyltransferase